MEEILITHKQYSGQAVSQFIIDFEDKQALTKLAKALCTYNSAELVGIDGNTIKIMNREKQIDSFMLNGDLKAKLVLLSRYFDRKFNKETDISFVREIKRF